MCWFFGPYILLIDVMWVCSQPYIAIFIHLRILPFHEPSNQPRMNLPLSLYFCFIFHPHFLPSPYASSLTLNPLLFTFFVSSWPLSFSVCLRKRITGTREMKVNNWDTNRSYSQTMKNAQMTKNDEIKNTQFIMLYIHSSHHSVFVTEIFKLKSTEVNQSRLKVLQLTIHVGFIFSFLLREEMHDDSLPEKKVQGFLVNAFT